MKSLDEKKLLLKMSRLLGQPDDPELVESIRKEEQLTEALFGKKKSIVEEVEQLSDEPVVESVQILQEADPPPSEPAPKPAETNIVPQKSDLVQQVANTISTMPKASPYRDKELEGIRKTLAEMMQKISTLSWGGGGTGIVRVFDADDFDRNSIQDEKQFVTFRNGWFQMDYINPNSIVANTTYITSNTYTISNEDYYIGVNVASTVTITLPPSANIYTGREFYVKDESGNAGSPYRWIDIYPSGTDKIDGQNYVRLQIDYGGLKFIYRDGWRVI